MNTMHYRRQRDALSDMTRLQRKGCLVGIKGTSKTGYAIMWLGHFGLSGPGSCDYLLSVDR